MFVRNSYFSLARSVFVATKLAFLKSLLWADVSQNAFNFSQVESTLYSYIDLLYILVRYLPFKKSCAAECKK